MSVMVREESTRDEVRDDLHGAVRARKVANIRYAQALVKAREQGWNNSEIARACGVSEAAIRLYWQRHRMPQPTSAEVEVVTALEEVG